MRAAPFVLVIIVPVFGIGNGQKKNPCREAAGAFFLFRDVRDDNAAKERIEVIGDVWYVLFERGVVGHP